MRIETVVVPEHTVTTYYYKYSELSDAAKENAKEWYLEGQEAWMFSEDCLEDLTSYYLPNSKVDIEYQLIYCQGDYFRIKGEFRFLDIWAFIEEKFTGKEHRFMEWVIREFNPSWNGSVTNHGFSRYDNICESIIDDLDYCDYRNVKYNVLEKFNQCAKEHLEFICSLYANMGYEFFYEAPEDEELDALCEANGWEFSETGEMIA